MDKNMDKNNEKTESDYTADVPVQPPEGFIEWLRSIGQLRGNIIVYKTAWIRNPLSNMKERYVQVKCSSCGKTFYQEYAKSECCNNAYAVSEFGFIHSEMKETVISGMDTLCPECGEEVKAYHVRNMRGPHRMNEVYPMTVQKVNNLITIIGWCVIRDIDKNAKEEIYVHPYEGYVFDGKRTVRLKGYNQFMSSISFFDEWQQMKRCRDAWGEQPKFLVYPWNASILNGTALENSKLDIYLQSADKTYPITYLRMYQWHKNVENLVMQGAGAFLTSIIQRNSISTGYYGQTVLPSGYRLKNIDWKQKRPSAMLGLSKCEFRSVIDNMWDAYDLDFYKSARKYGVKPEDVKDCKAEGYRNVEKIFPLDQPVMKVIHYLKRQRNKYENGIKQDIQYLIDYWNMAEKNGADMNNKNVRYPQNLINTHDTEVRQAKWKEDKELIELFKKRTEELQKYCYSSGSLIIRPAESENDLIIEGKLLNHCVASYAERHAKGETTIFFIRRTDEPDIPYYTLELDEKALQVRQNRGFKNCARTEEIKAFENEWLEFIKTLQKQKSRLQVAAAGCYAS